MEMTTALWSFALVVGLLTLTPGLDTALILRTSALGRRRQAWGVVLGIQTGTLIWGTLTSAGVTALLTASQVAYEVLRWAGAAYLVWMGVGMLRKRGTEAAAEQEESVEGGFGHGWRRGTLTNLLNPKVGVFYVAVLPQFIPAGAPHFAAGVALTCVHVVEGVLWSTLLVGFARVLRGWLRRPAARRVMDRVTGAVVVGFGLKLALAD
ncbi:LysE family translocator [Kitasatospora aureofaciens]|uniref:Lysine transporter LysE n=1 Tax=Kitasatospora aureofaciens TaxID=1894 RepID=A0A1E7NDC8_KITAU|nr:LysE family translocator [Kitasatospora aureofaciens]QEU98884.1 LysE family translocator [Streptomyces viridifaciens]ARF77691.1 lysine transporter LysE [Kitasatospora aureofaciens]OEV38658.1 lysine transporter LysE [Kitasatospora aureofaciens]UKZ04893.1 LysE family translocator [Streptomyces viridifaciens]GGU74709.1 lysine transporter LysE [Kitasatospora aureofaciens]